MKDVALLDSLRKRIEEKEKEKDKEKKRGKKLLSSSYPIPSSSSSPQQPPSPSISFSSSSPLLSELDPCIARFQELSLKYTKEDVESVQMLMKEREMRIARLTIKVFHLLLLLLLTPPPSFRFLSFRRA